VITVVDTPFRTGLWTKTKKRWAVGMSKIFKLNGAETRTVGNPGIAGDGLSDASWAHVN